MSCLYQIWQYASIELDKSFECGVIQATISSGHWLQAFNNDCADDMLLLALNSFLALSGLKYIW